MATAATGIALPMFQKIAHAVEGGDLPQRLQAKVMRSWNTSSGEGALLIWPLVPPVLHLPGVTSGEAPRIPQPECGTVNTRTPQNLNP
jgi:hypothetical protein